MDDFGNDFQDSLWFECCEEYGHSIATFGHLDSVALDLCMEFCLDFAAQEI